MRFTAVFVVFVAAGCFNPRIADGGFACNPTDPVPCPDGTYCRDSGDGYICTSRLGPGGPTGGPDMASDNGGGDDLAMPSGGDDMAMSSGGGDMAKAPGDMAKAPADMATGGSCGVSNLLINEVQTGSSASATDEFIEILNPCASAVSLSGSLVYRSSAGTTDVVLATISNKSIAAHGFFVAANSGFSGASNVSFNASTGLNNTGGGVAVKNGGGSIIDSMGWGDATNAFVQGSAATASNNNGSMARKPGANSHDNSADFAVDATPSPGAAN